MSTTLTRIGTIAALLALTCMGFASAETSATPITTTIAQATTGPAPTATPKPRWTYRGSIRAYDFTRQNASNSTQDSANTQVNAQSFNMGVAPHVDYNFDQNWSVGATYWFIDPFNGPCALAQNHAALPCKVVLPKGVLPGGSELNFDDTLPGYQINSLQEVYLAYTGKDFSFKGGNQTLTTPWAGANGGTIGSRIMPSSYQAVDATYKFNNNWQIEGIDSWKYLFRTQSDFVDTTNITAVNTSYSQGFGGLGSNVYNPSGQSITNGGFVYGRLGYVTKDLTANLHLYDVANIADIGWVDAKYSVPNVPLRPYVQFQGGIENSVGLAQAGKIDSSLVGLQGGVSLTNSLVFQVAGDYVPTQTTTLTLPTGFSCSSSTHTISAKGNTTSLPYFLPNGGTPDCNTVAGVTTLTSGGWASPYSDGYATDPIFTTSLTQGMTDRRAPGQSYMFKLIGTSDDHHLVSYISYAGYDYNQSFMAAPTYEWNLDSTYYFNKPAKPGQYYKGFIFRYRYGEREQPFTNAALPLFKYNRFQAEYDF